MGINRRDAEIERAHRDEIVGGIWKAPLRQEPELFMGERKIANTPGPLIREKTTWLKGCMFCGLKPIAYSS